MTKPYTFFFFVFFGGAGGFFFFFFFFCFFFSSAAALSAAFAASSAAFASASAASFAIFASAFTAGGIFGAASVSVQDIFGRQRVIFWAAMGSLALGLLLIPMTELKILFTIRFFLGFTFMLQQYSFSAWFTEFLPTINRGPLYAALTAGYPIGRAMVILVDMQITDEQWRLHLYMAAGAQLIAALIDGGGLGPEPKCAVSSKLAAACVVVVDVVAFVIVVVGAAAGMEISGTTSPAESSQDSAGLGTAVESLGLPATAVESSVLPRSSTTISPPLDFETSSQH